MSNLASLKLTASQKPMRIGQVEQRRNKLARRLFEQMELARAQQSGTHYAAKRLRSVVDAETGLRKQVEAPKRIKPWWFTDERGKLVLSVRYGAKVLELAKGKWAIEVGAEKELPSVLDVIKAAVLAGELDAAIEAAAVKLGEGFER